MGASPLVSAPGVAVLINSKVFGLVYDFAFNSSTPRKRAKSIDILQSLELIPLGAEITFSMGLYLLRGGGGLEGANITAPVPDLANEGYFSVVLLDLVNKNIIFQARRCSVEAQSWSVPVKQFITGQVTCSSLEWSNQVVPINGKQS